MKWTDTIAANASKAAHLLGSSIAFLKRKTGITVSDAEADALSAKAVKAMGDIEVILADLALTAGVPLPLAKLGAHAAVMVIDAGIAAAADSVKANN